MADNVAIDTGSGATIASDEIGGAHHQKVKMEFGTDGNATMVSSSDPLPTTIQDGGNSITVDDGGASLTIDGTVAATQSGTWTEANSASIKTSVELIDDAIYTDGTGTPSKGLAVMGTDGTNPQIISTNATGHLNIADGGNSITVDNGGTFAVQAAQSGTFNVTNVSGTVSLPTGAATAAKQPALGTAGTASSDVITVQGIASMTALKVDGSAVTQPVSGTVTVSQGTAANLNCTEASASAIKTSVELIDDCVIADNAGFTDGTTKVFINGYIYDEVAGTALTENDAAAARINVNRAQVGIIEDGSTRGRYATVSASNALKVDGSAVTQPVSGTITASNTAGDVAHDGADSGNPIKIGGVSRQTNPAAVADGDRVNAFCDDVGRQIVVLNQVRDLMAVQQTTITASTSETTIVTAAGSGVFADLTQLTITNSSATALIVTLKDSTAGTTRGIYALAANGGITISFPTPLAQASSNNNWTLTCGTSVSSIYVVAQYVKNV